MKIKIAQFFLLSFIVLMLGGILMSIKDGPSSGISDVLSEFDQNDQYHDSGYHTADPFDEENVNFFGKMNAKIGSVASNGINKGINFVFDLVKKIVS